MRDQLARLLGSSGILDILQQRLPELGTVVLYHSIGGAGEYCGMNARAFRTHMELLKQEFHVIDAQRFLWYMERDRRLPPRSVLVTLDDGFENNYSLVQPIMRELDLPWVVFVTTGGMVGSRMLWMARLKAVVLFMKRETFHILGRRWLTGATYADRLRTYKHLNRELAKRPWCHTQAELDEFVAEHWPSVPEAYVSEHCRMMSPGQVRELADSGLAEIGCHTRNHAFLPQVDDNELQVEIMGAMDDLRQINGIQPRMFAYPSSAYGRREIECVRQSGARCAFAVIPRRIGSPAFEIPRTGIYDRSASFFRAKALGLSSLLRRVGVVTG